MSQPVQVYFGPIFGKEVKNENSCKSGTLQQGKPVQCSCQHHLLREVLEGKETNTTEMFNARYGTSLWSEGFCSQKMEILTPKKIRRPPWPPGGVFFSSSSSSKMVLWFQNYGYELSAVGGGVWRWLCRHVRRKFSLMSMRGRAEGLVCADPGARTPIGVSGNVYLLRPQTVTCK